MYTQGLGSSPSSATGFNKRNGLGAKDNSVGRCWPVMFQALMLRALYVVPSPPHNHSTWEIEGRGLGCMERGQSHPYLYREFEVSLGYMKNKTLDFVWICVTYVRIWVLVGRIALLFHLCKEYV